MTETDAQESPIDFVGPMVRAILDGRKTQTRRAVTWRNSTVLGYPAKPFWPNLLFEHARPMTQASLFVAMIGAAQAPADPHLSVPFVHPNDRGHPVDEYATYRVRPKVAVGDRLWVREIWSARYGSGGELDPNPNYVKYRADSDAKSPNDPMDWHLWPNRWSSSTSMPRWASRITLEITGLKAERLQDISAADVVAEGYQPVKDTDPPGEYRREDTGLRFMDSWDTHGENRQYQWRSDPWVWCIEFKRVEAH